MWGVEFEREKLLQAYFADALPLDQFKREQTRIAVEIDGAGKGRGGRQPLPINVGDRPLLHPRCPKRLRECGPLRQRLWNRTLIERIEIKGGQLAGVALKQPFAGLFLLACSNKGTLVGGPGFEPGASRSRTARALDPV